MRGVVDLIDKAQDGGVGSPWLPNWYDVICQEIYASQWNVTILPTLCHYSQIGLHHGTYIFLSLFSLFLHLVGMFMGRMEHVPSSQSEVSTSLPPRPTKDTVLSRLCFKTRFPTIRLKFTQLYFSTLKRCDCKMFTHKNSVCVSKERLNLKCFYDIIYMFNLLAPEFFKLF
jgi:hypothetical protein